MQHRKQDLRLLLLSIEQLNKLQPISPDKLLEIFLDDEYRKELDENPDYQQLYQKIYFSLVNKIARQIVNRSRYLFVAIPRNEFLNLKTDLSGCVHYAAMTENFNNLSLEVKTTILAQESFLACIFALERWIDVMQRCLELYDFNSAVAIFAALNASAFDKMIKHVSAISRQHLDYMEKLISPSNQSENLRDAMMGRCIPLLSLYKGILIHTKEGSSEKIKLEEHELVLNMLASLQNMQKQNRAFMSKKPPQLLTLKSLYQRATQDLMIKLKNYKNLSAFDEIMKLSIIAKSKEDEEKVIEEIVYQVSKFQYDNYNDKDAHRAALVHELQRKMASRFPRKFSDIQARCEVRIAQIREYCHTVVKTDSDEVKSHKTKLKEVLRELRSKNVIQDKIDFVEEMLNKAGNSHSTYSHLLKKLLEVLQEKEEHDSYRKFKISRQKREKLKKVFEQLNITKSTSGQISRHSSNLSDHLEGSSFIARNKSKTKVTWDSKVLDNVPPESPRINASTKILYRSSVTIDSELLERARDEQHKVSTANIESSSEQKLKQRKFMRDNPKHNWADFLKTTTRSKRNSLIVKPSRPEPAVITHQSVERKIQPSPRELKPAATPALQNQNSTLFSKQEAAKPNKLRWSWPLVTMNDAQYPTEENPGIIVIKVNAKYYKK